MLWTFSLLLLFVAFSSFLAIKITNLPLQVLSLHYKALCHCLHGTCYLVGSSSFVMFCRTLVARSEMEESFPNAYVLAPRVKKKLESSSSSDDADVNDDLLIAGAGGPSSTSFPDDLDIHSVPPEFRKEGSDWLALFNPKVKRVLDVNLMHTLAHER